MWIIDNLFLIIIEICIEYLSIFVNRVKNICTFVLFNILRDIFELIWRHISEFR